MCLMCLNFADDTHRTLFLHGISKRLRMILGLLSFDGMTLLVVYAANRHAEKRTGESHLSWVLRSFRVLLPLRTH